MKAQTLTARLRLLHDLEARRGKSAELTAQIKDETRRPVAARLAEKQTDKDGEGEQESEARECPE